MAMSYALLHNNVNMIYFRYLLSHSSLDGSLSLVSKLVLSRMVLTIVGEVVNFLLTII